MSTVKLSGLFAVCAMLSGCASPAPEADLTSQPDISDAVELISANPIKSPGIPRLSVLPSEIEQTVEAPRPPLATFTQYDGQSLPLSEPLPKLVSAPLNAAPIKLPAKPRVIRAAEIARPKPAARPSPVAKGPPAKEAKAAPVTAPVQRRSVRATPSPSPRPVASTPRPTMRPARKVASAQAVEPALPAVTVPPRPNIVASMPRMLGNPIAALDKNPTALPSTPTAGDTIPIGTIPASLGTVNLIAEEASSPVADRLEQSRADDSGTLSWDAASALVRAGEVETAVDIGEFEVLMTLCSGRGIITIQPTPNAFAEIDTPKVICGKTASLTSQ